MTIVRTILIALFAIAAPVMAQTSLATRYDANDQGAVGGCVYFDLVVLHEVTLTRLDLHCAGASGQAGSVSLLTTPTSHLGAENNAASWTLGGTATVLTQGSGQPTPATFATGIRLVPGAYGVQLRATGVAHAFTAVAGGPATYTNHELLLTAGAAQNIPQGSPVVAARVWNGRLVYTTPPGYATYYNYGAGCYDSRAVGYESFAANGFDLAGSAANVRSLRFTRNAVGGYAVGIGSNTWRTPTSGNLGLGDDAVSAPQPLGAPFPFGTSTTTAIGICSNGYVWLRPSPVADWSPTTAEMLQDGPRVLGLWQDLDPSAGGTVHFDTDAQGAFVTFVAVPAWGTATPNTFQIALLAGGTIELRWQACGNPAGPALVGVSEGDGAGDPGSVDLSVAATAGFATPASVRPPQIVCSARPVVGSTVQLTTAPLPAGTVFGVTMLSLTLLDPGVDLWFLGMAGCLQSTNADAVSFLFAAGGALQYGWSLPNEPFFSGLPVSAQSFTFSAGYNPTGLLSSDAVRMVLGVQ